MYWCDDLAVQGKESTSTAMGTPPMTLFPLIIQLHDATTAMLIHAWH